MNVRATEKQMQRAWSEGTQMRVKTISCCVLACAIAVACASLPLAFANAHGAQQSAQSGAQNPPPVASADFENGRTEGSMGVIVTPCVQRPTQPGTHTEFKSSARDVGAGALPTYEFIGSSIVPHDPANEVVSGSARLISRTGVICDGYGALNVTVRSLIRTAFGVESEKIVGAPGWVNNDNFDVTINFTPATVDAMNSLPPMARSLAGRASLIPFMEDRLKLKFHRETRAEPIYALVVEKKGPKFHESTQPNTTGAALTIEQDRAGGYTLTGRGARIDTLVGPLQKILERLVVDRTGLTGIYDFTLTYAPQVQHYTSLAQMNAAPIAAAYKASVFDGLDKQLGLKLETSTGPVEVIVIDHIEKPAKE
jgi:uncharacterized protein (TIGR03435 family)